MPVLVGLAVVLSAVILLAGMAGPAAAFEQIVARELADPGYQTEMPGRPDGIASRSAPAASPEQPEQPEPRGKAFRPLFKVLLYGLLAIAAVFLVVFLVRDINRYCQQRTRHQTGAPATGGAAVTADRGGADRLTLAEQQATAGHYATAIHILLLHAIDSLHRQGPSPGPALTSREILRRPGLARSACENLAHIVSAVEVTRFGGRAADADDYRLCADACRRFVAGLAAGPVKAEHRG